MKNSNIFSEKFSNSNFKFKIFPWIMYSLSAIFYLYEYFLRITPSVMIPDLMQAFGIGTASLGNLVASYYYVYTPMQIPVGIMMDCFGPRKLLSISCFICALGALLFTHSLLLVAFIGRILIGIGSAFAFVGVLKVATIWLPPERFALMSGLASSLGTIGGMIGYISITKMIKIYGWKLTIIKSSIFGFSLSLILYLIIRDNPKTLKKLNVKKSYKKLISDLYLIFKNKYVWINGFVGFLLYLPTTSFGELWGVSYLNQVFNLDKKQSAWAISMLFLGWGITAPIAGWISDYYNKRREPMMIGGILGSLVISIIIFSKHLSFGFLSFLLFIFGSTYSVQVIVFAVSCELFPTKFSGTAIAFTNMIIMLSGVIFQPTIGFILEHCLHNKNFYPTKAYQYALSVLPIALILSSILVFFLRETFKKRKSNNK